MPPRHLFNSPQRPNPTSLHDKRRLAQRLPNPPDCKRPQNMPMPHHQHIPAHPLRLGLSDNRPMIFVSNLLDQPIHSLNNIFRRLAARTTICPDIPRPEPLLFAPFPDLLRRDALVLAVVPLADVRCDGDFCIGADGGGLLVRDLPGVGVVAAEVKELEGLLGTGARGDVSLREKESVSSVSPLLIVLYFLGKVARGTSGRVSYMWTSCFGTTNRSSPTSARPVARTRFSPFGVSGMSEVPVCRPLSDHSVSPCRTMKHRGVVMLSSE
jgi:hypothetical protein